MRLLFTMLGLLTLLFAPGLAAEEIKPGVQYQGPKKLGIASIGVEFELPKGWIGQLPEGEDTFVIGREGVDGYIFVVAEETTVAQAKADLSKVLPIDQLVMTPKGEATVKGSMVTNEYTVTGGTSPLVGKATAKVGKSGWGVLVLAISTPADLPAFTRVADSIATSLKITTPVKPKVPVGSTKGHWGSMFAGKRIVKFFHGSGYSEKQQIFMCPDGTFAYSFDGGGFSMDGFSGAMQSKQGGKWSTAGTAAGGTLTLNYNDGRTTTYQLQEQDGKLMLDGSRWLREAINCP